MIITKENSHKDRWRLIVFEKYGAGAVSKLYKNVKYRMSVIISNNKEHMLPIRTNQLHTAVVKEAH